METTSVSVACPAVTSQRRSCLSDFRAIWYRSFFYKKLLCKPDFLEIGSVSVMFSQAVNALLPLLPMFLGRYGCNWMWQIST